ncbi:hypothetical protein BDV95DRAFT_298782 [Massariosphaeria phaeospora]|uniref:Uncharacterized protein n=1 Tax=Massariosphaeria phaeospora TaxID=100035 RepID=A0A7C8ICS4_9PLEO|nr:hypothetical protein BDV95DRAFT_298782 [Massariosphaeria phaeospora]
MAHLQPHDSDTPPGSVMAMSREQVDAVSPQTGTPQRPKPTRMQDDWDTAFPTPLPPLPAPLDLDSNVVASSLLALRDIYRPLQESGNAGDGEGGVGVEGGGEERFWRPYETGSPTPTIYCNFSYPALSRGPGGGYLQEPDTPSSVLAQPTDGEDEVHDGDSSTLTASPSPAVDRLLGVQGMASSPLLGPSHYVEARQLLASPVFSSPDRAQDPEDDTTEVPESTQDCDSATSTRMVASSSPAPVSPTLSDSSSPLAKHRLSSASGTSEATLGRGTWMALGLSSSPITIAIPNRPRHSFSKFDEPNFDTPHFDMRNFDRTNFGPPNVDPPSPGIETKEHQDNRTPSNHSNSDGGGDDTDTDDVLNVPGKFSFDTPSSDADADAPSDSDSRSHTASETRVRNKQWQDIASQYAEDHGSAEARRLLERRKQFGDSFEATMQDECEKMAENPLDTEDQDEYLMELKKMVAARNNTEGDNAFPTIRKPLTFHAHPPDGRVHAQNATQSSRPAHTTTQAPTDPDTPTPAAKLAAFFNDAAARHHNHHNHKPPPKSHAKENASPSKSRRNASLPEEIAALAKDAMTCTEAEQQAMEQFRELDLAPLDAVMEHGVAGDLVLCNNGTPTKGKGKVEVMELELVGSGAAKTGQEEDVGGGNGGAMDGPADENTADEATIKAETEVKDNEQSAAIEYELDIPGHYRDTFKMSIKTHASPATIALYIRERARELDASDEAIEMAVEVRSLSPPFPTPHPSKLPILTISQAFLAAPTSFVVQTSATAALSSEFRNNGDGDDEAVHEVGVVREFANEAAVHETEAEAVPTEPEPEPPTFIKVISMLPQAMFWAAAAPVARVADGAFVRLVEAVTGLRVDGEEEEEGE